MAFGESLLLAALNVEVGICGELGLTARSFRVAAATRLAQQRFPSVTSEI
jgi:hypothetical protein